METNPHKPTLTLGLPTLHQPIATGAATWLSSYHQLVQDLERGHNRWGMQAAMLIIQGNLIAPVALLIFQYYDFGYQDYFAGLAGALFLGVLVANLALLPVRLILNLFLLNVALHAALIAWHLLR